MKNDHKVFIDLELISSCTECGRPVPVKLRHISSYGAGLTVEIDTEPHTCPVFCDVCGDEIVEGCCGCVVESKHHTASCKCRDCQDERGDAEYHQRKDDALTEAA